MRQQVASIMIQASTFSQRSLTDRFKGIWSPKQHDIACWPRRHLNMTQNVFFSSQRRRSTAELHRRVIVPLRPRFTKISFPLRFLLGTSLARVLQSDVQAQISSHDIFLRLLHFDHRTTFSVSALLGERTYVREDFLLSSARSFPRVACFALKRSQRYASASPFFRRNKSRGPRTLAWRVCFFSLFLSNRLCSLVNLKPSLLWTIRRPLRFPPSLLLLVRCCLYLTFN